MDIHRAQLTFDYVDLDSGEIFRGRIAPADREQLRGWLHRVHASLFHMGAPELQATAMSTVGRQRLSEAELSPATRTAVEVGMRQVDRLTEEMRAVREQITVLSRRQPACRALRAAHY